MSVILAHHEAFFVADAGAIAVATATAHTFWRRWYRLRARLRRRSTDREQRPAG